MYDFATTFLHFTLFFDVIIKNQGTELSWSQPPRIVVFHCTRQPQERWRPTLSATATYAQGFQGRLKPRLLQQKSETVDQKDMAVLGFSFFRKI